MATANFEDFYEVPNLNFDISKLKDDLDRILKLKYLKDDNNYFTFLSSYYNSYLLKKSEFALSCYESPQMIKFKCKLF